MFASIAGRYDLTNDVLSFGVHRLWRRKLVRLGAFNRGSTVLDLCTGTGDLAFCISRAIGESGHVLGLDFVGPMLELAKQKYPARSESGSAPISFFQGDAMKLPLADSSVDAATVAFGIRNVDNVHECLLEIRRVLKPCGKLLVLEFGQVQVPLFRTVYDWYSAHVMPLLGMLLTGNRAAYEYLPKTALAFPSGEKFLAGMNRAGYSATRAVALMGGIAYIYSGESTATASLSPQSSTDPVSNFSAYC